MAFMHTSEIVTYAITFFALYVQLFFLVTFFERRKELKVLATEEPLNTVYPSVAVIVPCWNEDKTVHGTVESLLALDWPKEKLQLVLVDDGSTDTTWQEILKYKNHPQIHIFQKENGGKHTAVNYGIEHTTSDFVSCLDADSFVAPDALKRIMYTFEKFPDVMAVAPSIIIDKPKNIMQAIQKVEYNMSLYNKRMLAFLNAIHVTPGPFSVFKREVFFKIGGFRKAHNTEDAEIAFRMQVNHMKIEHCHMAQVYTVAPDSVIKLYKQRLRWTYGFLQNVIDYRKYIFKKEYGNFALFTVPAGVISIGTAVYVFSLLLYQFGTMIVKNYIQFRTVGFHFTMHSFHFDPFFITTKTLVFTSILLYSFLFFAIIHGQKLAQEKNAFSKWVIPYMIIYSLLAPFWLIKAVYNVATAKKPSWR
jgi:cellulose synthase/poly-beta-1,6-N-acetylglucosamine synthase-like glycosyltransferase